MTAAGGEINNIMRFGQRERREKRERAKEPNGRGQMKEKQTNRRAGKERKEEKMKDVILEENRRWV